MSAVKQGTGGLGAAEDAAKTIQDGLAHNMELPRKLVEMHLAAGSELMKFAGSRLQAQAELLGMISRCANLEDAAAAQKSFFEKANEQYTAEMAHLMDITKANFAKLEAAANAASPLKTQ